VVEMLAFSNVLSQFGGYLKENSPVVITGRLSLRDDKDPQIVINRARPMSDFENGIPEEPQEERYQRRERFDRRHQLHGRLYLSIPSEDCPERRKVLAVLNMFPGNYTVILKYQDTGVKYPVRCGITYPMIEELVRMLGQKKVFLFLQQDVYQGKQSSEYQPILRALHECMGVENVVIKHLSF
jgi:DNA polymerase-3 subunit alpha